ncbi:TPA: hypothetical protein ACIPUI_002738 [Citrobacter freundii]
MRTPEQCARFSKIQRFIISYHLHGCSGRNEPTSQSKCFNPAGSGDTRISSCAFYYEPRAAFYTEKKPKKQNINARSATAVRKNFRRRLQLYAIEFKKNWKSGEDVT